MAQIAYALCLCGYLLRRLVGGRTDIVSSDEKTAGELLAQASPPPDIRYDCETAGAVGTVDLSVIVPVYNYERVLADCLDSVVAQRTKYRYEMIFVDDGSTDGSAQILSQYEKMENVRVLRQDNQGISAARNAALAIAAGNYIMFVDCDDYLEQNAVEVLLDEAYAGNCDIVEAAYYTFSDKPGRGRSYVQRGIRLRRNDFAKMMRYTGYPWGKVYRRDLFARVRFPLNAWFEDTIVKLLLFRQCERYTYLETPLYGYRKYEGNFTEKQVKSTRGLEHYRLLEWLANLSVTLEIGDEESLYLALLYHLGAIFEYRIASVEEQIQRQAFWMGGRLLEQYRPNNRSGMKIPFMYRELERAFAAKDFARWKLVCRYM